MPRYAYLCEKCNKPFQIVHSIKEKLVDCQECDTEGSLKRIPSMPLVLNKKEDNQKQEAGTLVKEYIEDMRGELKQEKEELRSQTYKDKDD